MTKDRAGCVDLSIRAGAVLFDSLLLVLTDSSHAEDPSVWVHLTANALPAKDGHIP